MQSEVRQKESVFDRQESTGQKKQKIRRPGLASPEDKETENRDRLSAPQKFDIRPITYAPRHPAKNHD